MQRRESGVFANLSFRSPWFRSARATLPKTDLIPCHATGVDKGNRIEAGCRRSSDRSGVQPEIINGMNDL